MLQRLPISSIALVTVDRIPLSLCCIGGTAININFVQCSIACSFCPWEANLDMKSAKIVQANVEQILLAVEKYKPDLIFFNGGDFWRDENTKLFIDKLFNLRVLKGLKIIAIGRESKSLDSMLSFAKIFDIVLIEVNRFSDTATTSLVIDELIRNKHLELVVVGEDVASIVDVVDNLVNELRSKSLYIPLNLMLSDLDEVKIYKFIDKVRAKYPLIHTLSSRLFEYSTILCPSCRNPVIVRQGNQLLKISIDSDCRCKYCNAKVISFSSNICLSRRVVKIPVNIPIA